MKIGIAKEIKNNEFRVAIKPSLVNTTNFPKIYLEIANKRLKQVF